MGVFIAPNLPGSLDCAYYIPEFSKKGSNVGQGEGHIVAVWMHKEYS